MAINASVIDLFCGVGGLSHGFKTEGFNVIAGLDLDNSCKYAFETNINAVFVPCDVTEVPRTSVKKAFNLVDTKYRVLVGCAPCTPFSLYASRYKRNGRNDRRWHLLKEFSRLAIAAKPDVISMENVPRLVKHAVFRDFVGDLEGAGYTVSFETVRAEDYGIPQKRARLVLFASLHGTIEMPAPSHMGQPMTVRDAIGHLPHLQAGQTHQRDRLHSTRGLTPKNLSRIRATKEGGGWQDWHHSMKLSCHKKKKGKTFRSVYGRMIWDSPSPVITTQCLGLGNGRFGHPSQDRAISIREAAILQSFPENYKFVPPKGKISQLVLARQIGNAVPPKLGRVIAKAIKAHLEHIAS